MTSFEEAVMAKLEAIRGAAMIAAKDALTLEECAAYTGYSVPTLYAFTSSRQIPHCKRGNRIYFPKEAVRRWLLANPVLTDEETRERAATYVALKDKRARK